MTTIDPIAAFRAELRSAAERGQRASRRRRLLLAAAAAAVALVGVTGVATGAVGWLIGSPAPSSVIADFGTYSPELGFHVQPGKAVQVASDGPDALYATPTAEGSYCIVLSTPRSRPPESMGGGYCIGKSTADQPIVAGLFPAGPDLLLLLGRISVSGATSAEVELPDGTTRTIPLQSSGFFLSAIESKACQNGAWSPQLLALNAEGKTVAASTIPLEGALVLGPTGAVSGCWLGVLTSKKAPSVNIDRK